MSNPENQEIINKCEACPLRLANFAIVSELAGSTHISSSNKNARIEGVNISMRILSHFMEYCDGPSDHFVGNTCPNEDAFDRAMEIAEGLGLLDIARIKKHLDEPEYHVDDNNLEDTPIFTLEDDDELEIIFTPEPSKPKKSKKPKKKD